jgi:hypothetical protein
MQPSQFDFAEANGVDHGLSAGDRVELDHGGGDDLVDMAPLAHAHMETKCRLLPQVDRCMAAIPNCGNAPGTRGNGNMLTVFGAARGLAARFMID